MIEAELKARLRDPDAVRAALDERADAEHAVYQDTYYDDVTHALDRGGRELRLRTTTVGAHVRHLLTYKDAPVDEDSGSKPEYETVVADRSAVEAMLTGLGYRAAISLTKRCENYAVSDRGRDVLATIATVPEIDAVYIEAETLVPQPEMSAALDDLRALLGDLGIEPDDLTTETYTSAVAAARDR